MPALAILTFITSALSLVEMLLPVLAKLKGGDITPEQQADLKKRYEAVRDQLEAHFTGPEWEVEP